MCRLFIDCNFPTLLSNCTQLFHDHDFLAKRSGEQEADTDYQNKILREAYWRNTLVWPCGDPNALRSLSLPFMLLSLWSCSMCGPGFLPLLFWLLHWLAAIICHLHQIFCYRRRMTCWGRRRQLLWWEGELRSGTGCWASRSGWNGHIISRWSHRSTPRFSARHPARVADDGSLGDLNERSSGMYRLRFRRGTRHPRASSQSSMCHPMGA